MIPRSILIHSFHRFLPYIGYVTIAMVRRAVCIFCRKVSQSRLSQNDFPQLKYALLGGLCLLALIQRE